MKKTIFIVLLTIILSACNCEAQKNYIYTENGQKETFTA